MRKLLLVAAMGLMSTVAFSHPCKDIAKACKAQGYVKHSHQQGKDLVKDCLMPVAMGQKTLPNTAFTPDQLQQCQAKIQAKMQKKQMRANAAQSKS